MLLLLSSSSTRSVRDILSNGDEKQSVKLTSVRGYRSQLLTFISHAHKSEQGANPNPVEIEICSDARDLLETEMLDLYRTLMQCGLFTRNTSRELKRACFLCIDSLSQHNLLIGLDRTKLHAIHMQLLQTLIFNSIKDETAENIYTVSEEDTLLYSLQEILIYATTRDIVLSTWEYIRQILRIVHHSACDRQVQLVLLGKQQQQQQQQQQQHSAENINMLDYASEWVPVGKTLEVAVQLCNILKYIFSPLVSSIVHSDPTWEEMKAKLVQQEELLQELKGLIPNLIQHLVVPILHCQKASTNDSFSISGIVLAQALRFQWTLTLVSYQDDDDDHHHHHHHCEEDVQSFVSRRDIQVNRETVHTKTRQGCIQKIGGIV